MNLMGVDIGSGGCKILIINSSGKVLAKKYREYETQYPHPGWAEQNPADWETALLELLPPALSDAGLRAKDVGCITIAAATHTVVLLDKKGEVLRPAILWTDRRTIKEVEWLRDHFGEMIIEETYHTPNVNWTLPYLLWVRTYEPEIWRKVDKILMPKDYIRHKLTGKLATDFMDAHGTLLFNVPKKCWSTKICDAVNIPREILPEVFPATQVAGEVVTEAGAFFGLCAGTPVLIGTTDQACEAFGSGAIRRGSGILKLATAGNVAVVTEKAYPSPPRVYAYYHLVKNFWYTLSGTSSCAVAYRWLRNTFFDEKEENAVYRMMDAIAEKVPLGAGGVLFHPNLQGSLGDPYLRADFLGLMSSHRKEHFVRAVLEGVAFSLYDCLQKEEMLGVQAEEFRLIGGGARSSLWRRIISDVFGRRMHIPEESDASFGAALLGGVGAGIFKSIEDAVEKCVRVQETVEPKPSNNKIYNEIFKCYQTSETALRDTYRRLHSINSN
jgi:xylulokinase